MEWNDVTRGMKWVGGQSKGGQEDNIYFNEKKAKIIK